MTTGKTGAALQHAITSWDVPKPQIPAAARAADAEAVSLEGRRALVVEDSWHIAIAMKCLLENAGLTVIGPAARSDVALELIAGQTIDVAVVDVNLHGTLALDLVDRLREVGTPVVVVSGYDRIEGLDGKVAAFLTKPVRSRALLSTLRDILGPSADN